MFDNKLDLKKLKLFLNIFYNTIFYFNSKFDILNQNLNKQYKRKQIVLQRKDQV